MISKLMLDLIEEANGLLILKNGEGFTEDEITHIIGGATIEEMQLLVQTLKREEVVGLFIATENE